MIFKFLHHTFLIHCVSDTFGEGCEYVFVVFLVVSHKMF